MTRIVPVHLKIRIAAVNVHRLSPNACADGEVLADFARDLRNLVADIICANPGPLDLRALLRATTTAFWSCVQPAACNIAFLLRKDMEFAKHSRLRKHGLVRMAETAGLGFVGALHIVARTVPRRTMRSPDFNMSRTSRGRKHTREKVPRASICGIKKGVRGGCRHPWPCTSRPC